MNKNHLKLWLVVLAVTFGFSIAVAGQTIKMGYAWSGKSGMASSVTTGFEQRIKEIAPQIQFEFRRDLPDMAQLKEAIDSFQKTKNGMVIIRSNGAQYLASNPPTIPTFIGGCNHPGELGTIKNLNTPEGNITGVTYYLPIETQFEVFSAILPTMKSLVLLVDTRNPSSIIDLETTQKMCDKLKLKCVYEKTTAESQVLSAVNKYKNSYSAFIIGNQAEVMKITKEIVKLAGKTPVLSYSSIPVKDGALGGFVADDVKLGRMLAESVVEVMLQKKPIRAVPVKVDPKPKFYLNTKTAEQLGVQIPFEILETAELIQ